MTEKFNADDFKDGLHIDRYHLDDELIMQSHQYYIVSSEVAYAISRRDEAYDNIKTVDAILDHEVRRDLETAGEKVTEGKVTAGVREHPQHAEAISRHLELKEEADLAAALKDSYQMRSYMLRELCGLHTSGYFADLPMKSDDVKNRTADGNRRAMSEKRKERKKREKLKD